MITYKGRSWHPQEFAVCEFAVCMAMDAFRLCLFGKPLTFTVAEIIAWILSGADEAKP